ncbi:c-type cytochrome [Nonlabens xiamenensis]|uniref:c-type cytochrome n=1 Tax=Nonlabens xiamenensis TaxID=2341043 RepID=UPI000F608374|nr:cytochrome c [Nonlabens xiamenensis]
MNTWYKTFIYALTAALLISCRGETKSVAADGDRSVQYFPNMYESAGYETYQEGTVFENNMEAQKPVEGTVSRGWMPYDYENSNEGYASAKANLQNPLPYTEENLENGSVMYGIYCAICHGKKGDGKGHLVETEKILGVPSYADRPITQGSIYHVMYYGINSMGSYASQTSEEERWQIAHHVDALRRDLQGVERQAFVKSGEVAEPIAQPQDTTMVSSDKDAEMEEAPMQPQEIEEQETETQTDGQ